MSHGRLRAAMNSITAPANFEHTGDTAGGWSLCFDECPSLSRHWVVTGDIDDAMAQLRQMLEAEGFSLGEWDTAGDGGRHGQGPSRSARGRGRGQHPPGVEGR